jgi:aminoglycoside phosphotransferase family enzyme/predicted kinase
MTSHQPASAAADPQASVLAFLGEEGGKRIDTHASVVFLGDDRVLKIKRAVRLPFLDYSTLEKRRCACEEEVRVNAVNAPELYRGVVPITRGSDGALEIGGTGTPIEWAVEMARFDEEQTLDHVARRKAIEPELVASLADAILRSHNKAPRAGGESWLASIAPIIDRNTTKFRSVRGLDAAAIDQLHAASHDHLTRLRTLLERRAERGFVRRCHGDLHLANVALVDGKPLLFDAIEFDPGIATTDILYDLAFTLMDLVHFDNAAAANTLFNRYLAGASDENLGGLGVLPLFLSMRAAIRAHVIFMKSELSAGDAAAWREAKRYLDLARRLIVPMPPLLVAIGGLSGTGKSVLARGLAGLIEPPPGAVIVRSDVVRKRLLEVNETTALPDEAYQADTSARVYDALYHTARRVIARGLSVVIDASFMDEAQRMALLRLTRKHGMPFVGLFLTADLATRLARIAHRKNDASDATRDVALKQETADIGAMDWHLIDASGTPGDTLQKSIGQLERSANSPERR